MIHSDYYIVCNDSIPMSTDWLHSGYWILTITIITIPVYMIHSDDAYSKHGWVICWCLSTDAYLTIHNDLHQVVIHLGIFIQ